VSVKERQITSDPYLHFYSKSRIRMVSGVIVAWGAAFLLFTPSFLFGKIQTSQTLAVTIALGFVGLFSLGIIVLTDFKRVYSFLLISGYCAVLLGLIGLLHEPRSGN
jgi:hypothetical protein